MNSMGMDMNRQDGRVTVKSDRTLSITLSVISISIRIDFIRYE